MNYDWRTTVPTRSPIRRMARFRFLLQSPRFEPNPKYTWCAPFIRRSTFNVQRSMSIIQYQHTVAIAAKLVAVVHSFLIGFHNEVVTSEGSCRHQHGRLRVIEIDHHAVG